MSGRSHPTFEDLDDAVDGTAPAEVTGHLTTCPDCRGAVAALARIRIDLAALEPVEMPPDVTARIELALRAEQVPEGPQHWGTARTSEPGPAHRRRPALIGAAAGVAVLAVAGAVLGFAVSGEDRSGGTASTAGSAAVAGPEARVPSAARAERAPEQEYDRTTVAGIATGVVTAARPVVPACLALATRSATVLRVVQADFEGVPAVIGVVSDSTGLRVVVVGRSCPGATSVRPLYAAAVTGR